MLPPQDVPDAPPMGRARGIATLAAVTLAMALLACFAIWTASAHASTLPRCRTGQLAVSATRSGAAAGTVYYRLRLANTSSASCTLAGYPGVSFVSRPGGHQVGRAATRSAGWPARTVTLAPGGSVVARLGLAEVGNWPPAVCEPVDVRWVKVYPPNAWDAVTIPFRGRACSTKARDLSVTPVEAPNA